MFPTKALGPNGFPTHFFQKHWHLCGEEITQIFIRLHNGDDSLEDINETFIVIIPKVKKSYICLSVQTHQLVHVVFKIASKVLVNRLKRILREVVSGEKSYFVPSRLITDNIITAYECLHLMKSNRSKKNSHCAVKLDMMKAYDRL
jgi:hypothetical protein